MNTNNLPLLGLADIFGEAFHGIRFGDRVTFWHRSGMNPPQKKTARALRYLIFPDHVVVDCGPNGYAVSDTNYISHKTKRI